MSSSAQPEPFLPDETPSAEGPNFDQRELQAALQLLVERAQFITGATGATLALPEGDEMVCRASAGSSAPPAGARLQVRSGLTGESIARRQLLRCDNAENDPRVNLETCREMGIASIVVMPLARRDGNIRGLFELFSDHPYAFEERDLCALERMAELTLTALDLAENPSEDARPIATALPEQAKPVPARSTDHSDGGAKAGEAAVPPQEAVPVREAVVAGTSSTTPMSTASTVPEAMRRVQKCSSCGFPVSEGRVICLDCENKQNSAPPPAAVGSDFVPSFLGSPPPAKESWYTNPVNILAILVVIAGILVAIVVFH